MLNIEPYCLYIFSTNIAHVQSWVGCWVVCDLEERLEDVPDDILKVADPRIPRALEQHMTFSGYFILFSEL
jgi:hypothetical protein